MVGQVQLAGVEASRAELEFCTLDLAAPAAHILASRVVGMGSLAMVERVVAFGDELRRHVPRIQIFHDFTGVKGYQSEARKVLVGWGVDNKDSIAATHVLFQSRIVSMGVSLARHLLPGQLEGYSNRGHFDAALARAIEQGP